MNHLGSLLVDAGTLMVTGMLVVFLFLTIMVYAVTFMSKILPEETPAIPPENLRARKHQEVSKDQPEPRLIAAISAAVYQYRSSTTHR